MKVEVLHYVVLPDGTYAKELVVIEPKDVHGNRLEIGQTVAWIAEKSIIRIGTILGVKKTSDTTWGVMIRPNKDIDVKCLSKYRTKESVLGKNDVLCTSCTYQDGIFEKILILK